MLPDLDLDGILEQLPTMALGIVGSIFRSSQMQTLGHFTWSKMQPRKSRVESKLPVQALIFEFKIFPHLCSSNLLHGLPGQLNNMHHKNTRFKEFSMWGMVILWLLSG